MFSCLFDLALAFGLGYFFKYLISEPRTESGPSLRRQALEIFSLTAFAACAMMWIAARAELNFGDFPLALAPAEIINQTLLLSLLGAAAFAFCCPSKRGKASAQGFALGVAASALGFCAYQWLSIGAAWRILGWFCGSFIWQILPLVLALSLALVMLAVFHDDFRQLRLKFILVLLLLWWIPAKLALWNLEKSWGYGPQSLAEAAHIPATPQAERCNIFWLRPSKNHSYTFTGDCPVAEEGVDISVKSLGRLYDYLITSNYHSLFAHQALAALRRGWLDSWDADTTIEADRLAYPGRAFPDYRGALGLIRAGPLTLDRYQKLQSLDDLTKPRREGFEDVTQSQYIFEAFEAAYARFGDDERARYWLAQIDNLWPIYEKKIEASPVEAFHDGKVHGSVFLNGKPAHLALVGLFYLPLSTAPITDEDIGTLSESDFPNFQGQFYFSDLGSGRYYLGLMGQFEKLRGKVQGSPGFFTVDEDTPTVKLAPIYIRGSGLK